MLGRLAGQVRSRGELALPSPRSFCVAWPAGLRSMLPWMSEYDDDFGEDEPPSRHLVLAKDIDEAMRREYVELVRSGYDVATAARLLGSNGSQFKKLRNGGYWHDPAFADQVEAALVAREREANAQERVRSMVWEEAENGNWRAIEKLAYAHLPEFEKLRHTNLRVSGEVFHAWKAVLPHLSDDEIQARIEAAQTEKAPIALLPSPDAA